MAISRPSIERTGGVVALRPIGRPYKRLLADLTGAAVLARFGLAAAAQVNKIKRRAAGH